MEFLGTYPNRIRSLEAYQGRFNAFRLRAQGADVLFAGYASGELIPRHVHDTNNYGVVLKGRLLLDSQGERRTYTAGEWYELAAGTEHEAYFEADTEIIEFWFGVEPTVVA